MTSSIVLSGVTKTYRKRHLGKLHLSRGITDVSLEVRRGEVFGLLGLNGAGKTTTLKLILGLLSPTAGTLSVEGGDARDPAIRARLGYLPETALFYRHLTADETLRFYGRLSGIPEQELSGRVDSALDRVRMTSSRHRRMGEFSKGMLQRINIAQALLHHPPILILDEPVTGLDPLGLAEMRDLIQALNQEGRTVLFSSHNIAEVERICHRAAILREGALVRLVEAAEWRNTPGALERLFVQEVTR